MSEETVSAIRGVYESFGAGDVGAVLGAFDPNIEWTEAAGTPYGGTYHGPDAVAQNVFAAIMRDVDGFVVAPEEYVDAGDRVVALGTYSGRGKESGTEFAIPFAHAWTVRDGRVTSFQQYVDSALWNEAVVARPAPA